MNRIYSSNSVKDLEMNISPNTSLNSNANMTTSISNGVNINAVSVWNTMPSKIVGGLGFEKAKKKYSSSFVEYMTMNINMNMNN